MLLEKISFLKGKNLHQGSLIFLRENPLLFYSLCFSLGILLNLYHNFLLPLFFIPFLFISSSRKVILITLLLTSFGYLYTLAYYKGPKEEIKGSGIFSISSVSSITLFKPGFLFKGKLKTFENYRNLTCQIYYTGSSRPKADKDYKISGRLIPISDFQFILKPEKGKKWLPIAHSHSFAEKRYALKQAFSSYLKITFSNTSVQNFLSAIVAGELDDIFLRHSFAKTGIIHVLVIAGLHFNMIVTLFSLLLSSLRPSKRVLLLLLITNCFFLFVGPTPPIQRAYIAIQLSLLGELLSKKNFPTNALGLALLIQALINPTSLTNIGLQLSYLSSFGILIFSAPISNMLSLFLKKRTPNEIKKLNLLSKQGYIISCFLKEGLAVTISVNLVLIPLILFYFHKAPFLSFLYNLFFPPLVLIVLFLFIIGALFYPISLVATLINLTNDHFTKYILDLVTYPPYPLLFYLYFKNISSTLVVGHIALLLLITVALYGWKKNKPVNEIFKYF